MKLMRSEEEIMELYNEHEKLIHATIYRRYSDPSYRNAHGLEKDDLIQYGRLGLYQACKTFDVRGGFSFRTHAISNIIWTVNNESKKDSLHNISNKSNKLANKTSLDAKHEDSFGDTSTLHDIVECVEEGFEDYNVKELLDNINKTISEDMRVIIEMKLKGHTFEEIGDVFGISRQAVKKRLLKNESAIRSMLQVV